MTRLGSAQKGRGRGSPAYSVYVNRPAGRLFAAIAVRAGLNPDQVTAISAVFSFTGIALIALIPPAPWVGLLAALLLLVGYAWDSADGQVARLRGGGSAAGEWLDHVVDAVKILSLHAAVLVGVFRHVAVDPAWLLVPIGFEIVAGSTFMASLLNDLLRARAGMPSSAERGGGSAVRSIVLLPLDYGVLCVAVGTYGWPVVFLPVYAVFGVLAFAFAVLAFPRWFREMRRVGRAQNP